MAKRGTVEWRKNISRGVRTRGADPLAARQSRPGLREIAWAAGFFEGEGSVGLYQWRSHGRLNGGLVTAKVTQVQKQPLDRLVSFFGGRQHRWVRRRDGRGYWQWQISGARAVGFLLTIYPLMSPVRQAQIRNAVGKWKERWNEVAG